MTQFQTLSPATRRVFADRAVSLLSDVEGLIRGYVFIWGDPEHRDEYKTFFDRARPPETATNDGMHRRPISYEHMQDGVIRYEVVGVIDRVGYDDVGMWYEGHLYRSNPFFERIVGELRRKVLKTSSATGDNTADFYPDGAFRIWVLNELALTQYPAEKRMPATVLVRSHQEEQEVPRAGDAPPSTVTNPTFKANSERSNTRMTPEIQAMIDQLLASGMSIEDILNFLKTLQAPPADPAAATGTPAAAPVPAVGGDGAMLSAPALAQRNIEGALRALMEKRQREAAEQALRSDLEGLKTTIAQLGTQMQSQRNAPPAPATQRRGSTAQGGAAPITGMRDLRYAHLSPSDMWFIRSVLEGTQNNTSEDFNRAMAHKTFGMVERDKAPFDADYKATVRSAYTRADDFMATDIAGQGLEWVGQFFASEIWEKARVEVELLNEMRSRGLHEIEVPQGSASATVFLEGNDPTWYTTAQANDKDAVNQTEVVVNINYMTTASIPVTPGQITSAVAYTDILEEDSMIPVAPQLNAQYQAGALEVIEYVLINADTATGANTNINLIDGTPGTGLAKPAYLVSNGLLKLPLVTQTSMARDALGLFNENTFQATLKKLPKTIRGKKDKILWLMDTDTYEAALTIPALKTLDVAGQNYTAFTGQLPPKVYGVKPVQSGQMDLANSAGKIPAAGGTLGRLAAVYCPYWALVWKRQLTFEQARAPLSQANLLIGSMRLALRYRSNNAAALSYNLPVTVSE